MKRENTFELPIFLTTKEAARFLKITTHFLRQLHNEKKGPPVYQIGKRFRFRQSDLIRWVEEKRVR